MLQTHSYYTYTLDYLLSKTKHQTPGFHMDVIQLEAEKHVMPCANVPMPRSVEEVVVLNIHL